jgi:hypothetical protein
VGLGGAAGSGAGFFFRVFMALIMMKMQNATMTKSMTVLVNCP